jgi:hypothetical protein
LDGKIYALIFDLTKKRYDTMYIPKNDSDALQPQYMFCCTANDLLAAICKGEIEPKELARIELAKRGFDENAKFVGFNQIERFAK